MIGELVVGNFGRIITFTVISMVGLAACGSSTNSITTQCVTDPAQASLYEGHWTTHPIPLAVEANDFSASELQAIQAAIGTWNTFFSASKSFELYLSGTSPLTVVGNSGTRLTSATVCGSSTVTPSGFSNTIKIYRNSTWSYSSDFMALTSLCPVTVSSSPYKQFFAAVMEINFQNYFVAGTPQPDLQSVVTHELGHMLGLNHSCVGTGCTGAPSNYTSAVMYPSLGFVGVNGIQNRSLQTNDQERANCLY